MVVIASSSPGLSIDQSRLGRIVKIDYLLLYLDLVVAYNYYTFLSYVLGY